MYAVQFTDHVETEAQAIEQISGLAMQIDYLAGRITEPGVKSDKWMVQAIFEDCGEVTWLPDGCRRVMIPRGFLGLNRAA